jgi:2-polyprenyl-3-methyl-5-hydroxy-6-metoxy-1,4-benzoquinol methylase
MLTEALTEALIEQHPLPALQIDSESAHPGPCRFCGLPLQHVFVDLGQSPLANSYLRPEDIGCAEASYPLRAFVCDDCFLVQLEEWQTPENIFSDYAYFSSYSDSWLDHASLYVEEIIARFGFGPQNKVVEIASNDGYLLQNFVQRNIPVLGIEPARNVAEVARAKGIPTLIDFFGEATARKLRLEGHHADLMIANNVFAHVPDLNDFTEGMRILLSDSGVLTVEFPHLARLIRECQLDTIYHEHFSYFSFVTAERIFAAHGLTVFDVEELSTHGGSLRLYVQHSVRGSRDISWRVEQLRQREIKAGLTEIATYTSFGKAAAESKRRLLEFLTDAKRAGKQVAGYGAPAKGNTLLNYCGISTDLVAYTVDRNPHKQGHLLPGTHIPIYDPERIRATKPDYILILPWNLQSEIIEQLAYAKTWGARFIVPIPEPHIVD